MTESHLPWATEEAARRISDALEEPGWLLDERLDAAHRVADLPDESNTLWTTYLDLRPVRFDEVTPYGVAEAGRTPDAADEAALPLGAAALLHVAADRVVGRALSPQARAADVFVGTFAEALRDRPEILRSAIDGGRTIASDDRFGQVARAIATLGVLVHVPPGVELSEPIVLRWSAGEAGRALLSRSAVVIGDGSRAGLLEELVPGAGPVAMAESSEAQQSQWWGTSEVVLGDGSALHLAGLQDFGPATASFVTRTATTGRDAALDWALAHVGGAWSKSRIDNHLVGQGSSVHQAEIAFGGGSQVFDL